ncbi:hypothetical protein [Zobellia laminariae]|uniref:hypothetical protein n=1 Tax=Zobellia laminariae TaxID=248906 RepID=UPI0026F41B05|nr:hypothetical protein [Zobellia laminariae]WKX76431.1 hypothetical protein Q5W13_23305 [Zobellia laminariae]
MNIKNYLSITVVIVLLNSCATKTNTVTKTEVTKTNAINVDAVLADAEKQLALQTAIAESQNKIPRTVTADGEMHWAHQNFDWTEGFFPGSQWFLYQATNNEIWKTRAEKSQGFI